MNEKNLHSLEISALFSVILVSIISMLITLGKEFNSEFKDFFISIAGHHWWGHGVVILILFIVFWVVGYLLVKRMKKDVDIYKWMLMTIVVLTVTSLVILIAYAVHIF